MINIHGRATGHSLLAFAAPSTVQTVRVPNSFTQASQRAPAAARRILSAHRKQLRVFAQAAATDTAPRYVRTPSDSRERFPQSDADPCLLLQRHTGKDGRISDRTRGSCGDGAGAWEWALSETNRKSDLMWCSRLTDDHCSLYLVQEVSRCILHACDVCGGRGNGPAWLVCFCQQQNAPCVYVVLCCRTCPLTSLTRVFPSQCSTALTRRQKQQWLGHRKRVGTPAVDTACTEALQSCGILLQHCSAAAVTACI